ncbi:HNH endonuclease [Candidatus Dojkabacteria bacterium]|jgi:hypothetical protein|nr:HNH endonuclease [Candidatus Dojkabacteria bacterium]
MNNKERKIRNDCKYTGENSEVFVKEKTCLECGKLFIKKPNTSVRYFNKIRRFCSHACYSKHRSKEFVGEKSGRWNGGKVKNTNGYVRLMDKNHRRQDNNHYVAEHILIAENILKRPIEKTEVIHHINGIKNDNRPENLYLFNDIGEHHRYHDYLRWKSEKLVPITQSNLQALAI